MLFYSYVPTGPFMRLSKRLILLTSLALFLTGAPPAFAVVIGQVDDFEDGTTQGWIVGLLGAAHPAPPMNVPTGGPAGVDDNYLLLTAVGGGAAGSRLTVLNPSAWAGDYTADGILVIAMDLKNFGGSDLNIRLWLEDPTNGPPVDIAFSGAVSLPSGGDWTHVEFAIDPMSLTAFQGDVNTLLSNVTTLRIYHSPDPTIPGPSVVASLGVDNITAGGAAAVPEPSSWMLLGSGLAGLRALRRKRTPGQR